MHWFLVVHLRNFCLALGPKDFILFFFSLEIFSFMVYTKTHNQFSVDFCTKQEFGL